VRKIIKILLNLALFFLQALIVIKSFFIALFKLIAKPGLSVLRFFYYILILPIYRLYLLVGKKLGLSKSKKDKRLFAILVNKKLTHFLFIFLVILMTYFNLFRIQDNISSEEVVGKTLLAKIVSDEFVQAEQLIEEYQETNLTSRYPSDDYWSRGAFLRAPLAVDYSQSEEWLSADETDYEQDRPRKAPSRTEAVEYTVKTGDTISSIAQYFGVSINTILWENSLTAKSYIKPGDKLSILPMTGVMHTVAKGDNLASIAKKYDVEASEILASNSLANANQIRIGEKLIIPGGMKIAGSATASTARKPLSLAQIITGQREPAAPVAGNKMNWPTQGRITQYYSWRHNGLDIANKLGTPIYAAEAGTVTEAAWNAGGYGYYIVVDHGGGKKTRYAHLSKFACKVGDEVDKGENIGYMGSTGRSTGPHLHFEVMIYGKRYNPLSYLY